MPTNTSRSPLLMGSLFGMGCAFIWAGWILITSFGTKHQVLRTVDIVFLRYTMSGLIFLPYLLKKGINIGPKGWIGIIIMTIGAGPVYLLFAAKGMACTSVCHVGGLLPGTMPMFTAILSIIVLKDRISFWRVIGLFLIITGALTLTGLNILDLTPEFLLNYSSLLSASFVFCCFTVAMKYWEVNPIHAAAIVSVFSAAIYGPIYFLALETTFMQASWSEIIMQTFYQGVMAGVIALIFYGKAIEILGASKGAVFVAMVPALATIMAIPFLGEVPGLTDWVAIFTLTFGVILATGVKFGPVKAST